MQNMIHGYSPLQLSMLATPLYITQVSFGVSLFWQFDTLFEMTTNYMENITTKSKKQFISRLRNFSKYIVKYFGYFLTNMYHTDEYLYVIFIWST